MCILLIIVQFYLSVWPLGDSPSAENFFANYISVIVIVVLWIGAVVYYSVRGKRHWRHWWVDLDTINLDEGRRFYGADVEKEKVTGVKGVAKKVVGAVFN